MADEKKIWNVIILGTGPAGLTAALYTAIANLSPLILHGNQPGGQLTPTTEIENFPGFIKGIDGNELIDNMTKQSERFGAIFEYGVIQEIDTTKRPFVLKSSTKTLLCKISDRFYWRQTQETWSSFRRCLLEQGCYFMRHMRWLFL